jgi:tetratricopeptide (TPR) repeat protein
VSSRAGPARLPLAAALALLLGAGGARGLEPGDRIEDAELRGIDGTRHHLLGQGARASVVVFVRPDQEHSLDTLHEVATCETDLAARGVHWVAVVSGSTDPGEAQALVAATGIKMPVVFDEGDRVYGRLGVKLHPTVEVIDGAGKLSGTEPFRAINYCDRVVARIRFVMGEISAAQLAQAQDPPDSGTRTDAGVARRHANLARRFLALGQLKEALAEVQQSLMIAPSGEAYVLQGQILARQGNCKDATRAFQVALKLEPANGEARSGSKGCPP